MAPSARADRTPRPRLPTRIALGVLTAAVLGVTAPGASAATACADIDARPEAVGITRATAAVGCLVNHERTAAGLNALSVEGTVRTAAQAYALDMAVRNFFAHLSPEGTDPGSRLLAAGFDWLAYGENLASGQPTAREAMKDWLASPGHCRNLMTPHFTVAGYGVATSSSGPYWVQEFGRPMRAGTAPSAPAAPSCPRLPTPLGAPTPAAAPVPAVSAPTTPATARAQRSGRRLRVTVKLPAGAGATTLRLRVRQAGRTVRSSTLRRPAGSTLRVTVRLPKATGGRVTVRAGSTRTVGVSFR